MTYKRAGHHSHDIHRQQDDWDEVHNQLLAIQKKSLTISDPNDADEKEADEVAGKVMNGESSQIHGTSGAINRKSEGTAESAPGFQTKLAGSKGSGQTLPENLKQEMGSKMSADFSNVKIHTGNDADEMNESVNAKAFTHGNDIYFKNNNYNPGTSKGKELLAHELVHTKQQSGSKIRTKLSDDYLIKGKYQYAETDESGIYFDYDSAIIDDEEIEKIKMLAESESPLLSIIGQASEEGNEDYNEKLSARRAQAVKRALELDGYAGKINTEVDKDAGTGHVDYRAQRKAKVIEGKKEEKKSPCESDFAPCSDEFNAAYKEALEEAERLVINGKNAITNPTAETSELFIRIFKTLDNKEAVSDRLSYLFYHLQTEMPTNFRCASDCNAICESATAYNEGEDENAMMTFCPTSFMESYTTKQQRAGVLIHEGSHGSSGFKDEELLEGLGTGSDDNAYVFFRKFNFLTAQEALENADSYRAFLIILDGGTLSSMPEDKLTNITDDNEKTAVMKSLAMLETYLSGAQNITLATYSDISTYHSERKMDKNASFSGSMYAFGLEQNGFDISLTGMDIKPTNDDKAKVAAINDRVTIMFDTIFGVNIEVEKQSGAEIKWEDGPGGKITVNEEFFKLSEEDQTKALFYALAKVTPGMSLGMIDKYYNLAVYASMF